MSNSPSIYDGTSVLSADDVVQELCFEYFREVNFDEYERDYLRYNSDASQQRIEAEATQNHQESDRLIDIMLKEMRESMKNTFDGMVDDHECTRDGESDYQRIKNQNIRRIHATWNDLRKRGRLIENDESLSQKNAEEMKNNCDPQANANAAESAVKEKAEDEPE